MVDNAFVKYGNFVKSLLYEKDGRLNSVTDLQHELWTTVLDHWEKYQLWFHWFSSLDRVRLWNKLVFSEGYFRLLANSKTYNRYDLQNFFNN